MPTKSITPRQYRIDNNLPVKKPVPKPKRQPGTPRNKWEQEMFNLLTALVKANVIFAFGYEGEKMQLTKHCSYKPDFCIVTNKNKTIILEVKSAGRDNQMAASILRFRIAADLYEQYRFVMLTKKAGKWVVKYDLNKGSAELPKEIVND